MEYMGQTDSKKRFGYAAVLHFDDLSRSRTFRIIGCWVLAFLLFFGLNRQFGNRVPSLRFHKHLISDNNDVLEDVANDVDWSRFAYVQYVTNLPYLCNSLMLFASLQKHNCRAEKLMMYPSSWKLNQTLFGNDSSEHAQARLVNLARDKYGVRLQPVEVMAKSEGDPTWSASYTKLLALNQTDYARVLSLDSDSTVYQCMDELFLLPSAPVVMPRAYYSWPKQPTLGSQFLLVQPKADDFKRVEEAFARAGSGFDMEILNEIYFSHATIISHRGYGLLTGEYKKNPDDHAQYLGSKTEQWDPEAIFNETKYLHFSDWPVKKPWALYSDDPTLMSNAPKCHDKGDCRDRKFWLGFYEDFRIRREEVCGFF